MDAGEKYKVNSKEGEHDILPNKLNLTVLSDLEQEEAKGFVKADVELTLSLSSDTLFNVDYIYQIHKTALSHLYEFAGQLRTVNISKAGFMFPSAQFLSNSMSEFQNDILNSLPISYSSKQQLIDDIARVHAELLYIHPFREGNGRTARMLANHMSYKAGYDRLKFEKLNTHEMFKNYVSAVQNAGLKKYDSMSEIISLVFE